MNTTLTNYLDLDNKDINYCCYSGLHPAMANIGVLAKVSPNLTERDIDRIIEMAWEDRTSFDAIEFQFGLNEAAVKVLMKKELKFSSYILWRKRVENCKTKHASKRKTAINRFKCNLQRNISSNKIAKRR